MNLKINNKARKELWDEYNVLINSMEFYLKSFVQNKMNIDSNMLENQRNLATDISKRILEAQDKIENSLEAKKEGE